MNASSASHSWLGRATVLALTALVAMVGMFAFANTSRAADTYTMTIDNGRLNLGAVFPNNTIIPAPVAEFDDPDPANNCAGMPPNPAQAVPGNPCGPSPLSIFVYNTSPDGSMDVEVDGTTATVANTDLNLPQVYVVNPTASPGDANYWVPIAVEAPNGLTGTWDAGTGALDLAGDLRINVFTGAPDLGQGPPWAATMERCQIDVPGVEWSTDKNAVTPGVPFDGPNGLEGEGALSTSWPDLPNGTERGGASDDAGDCSTVNAVIHDLGSIWLSNGITNPPAAPTCVSENGEGWTGLWPNCNPPACPEGTTGTYPDCVPVVVTKPGKIGAFNVKPKNRAVKKGKKVVLKLTVRNTGDKVLKGKVNIKAPKAKVKVRKAIQLNVPGKKAKVYKVPVTVKKTKKAKGQAKVVFQSVKQKGKKAVAKIKIRK